MRMTDPAAQLRCAISNSWQRSLQTCIAVTDILGQVGLRNRSNRVLTQCFGISFALLRKLNDLFG
jgi:hypothetical protein